MRLPRGSSRCWLADMTDREVSNRACRGKGFYLPTAGFLRSESVSSLNRERI